MKKYFLTVVYAIDDKPETVEAILAQRPWQAVAHTDALADLEHAQADLQAATDGYDAARLEIESLQARVQEHVRSGKDWAMRVEALERTITTLRAHIASSNAQAAAAKKAMRELEAQVAAVGAGGVEPLRKRECLHQISEPAQPVAQAQDAARYQFLRDGEWRDTELEPFIRLQLNTMWDAKIDAAIAAQKGEKS